MTILLLLRMRLSLRRTALFLPHLLLVLRL